MKNDYYTRLSEMKHTAYMAGFEEGKELERMAITIALNEVFGLAGDRLKRLEPILNEIWAEMKTDEPELFASHLIRRARQIKGVTVGTGEKNAEH